MSGNKVIDFVKYRENREKTSTTSFEGMSLPEMPEGFDWENSPEARFVLDALEKIEAERAIESANNSPLSLLSFPKRGKLSEQN